MGARTSPLGASLSGAPAFGEPTEGSPPPPLTLSFRSAARVEGSYLGKKEGVVLEKSRWHVQDLCVAWLRGACREWGRYGGCVIGVGRQRECL